MSQDRSALGIWACRNCRTPVLENHRDDKTPDDKIGHVLIVTCCSLTSSLAQPPKNFGHLLWPAGPLCIAGGNLLIQMLIVRELIDRKRWFMHQNEANKQYFALIRWLYHIGDWTPHSMTRTVKIGQNWLSNGLLRQIFPEFWETDTIFEISVSNFIRKKCGERNFETKI